MHTLQRIVFPADSPAGSDAVYLQPGTQQEILGAHTAELGEHATHSFATYFNAFPATYWTTHTAVDRVTLALSVHGSGILRIYRSDLDGRPQQLHTEEFRDRNLRCAVDLRQDTGWLWFTIETRSAVRLESGEWQTATEPARPGRVTVGITTVNKPDFVVRTLELLSKRAEVRDVIDSITVVDQGTDPVRAHPGFREAAGGLDGTLNVVEQANLGGSGGFARAMLAGTESAQSTGTLLLDDDVRVEPDSIYRSVQFSRYTHTPVIVGGHMFDLSYPTVLHSWAERVDPVSCMWGPSLSQAQRHDFASTSLDHTPWAHTEAITDYNGWYMCLIPRQVSQRIGYPAPFFIKWDDSEYGLRAKAAGIETVTLPGMALWHVSWLDKDDSVDWQAYFHTRNRIVTALVHSDRPRGGHLIRDIRRLQLKQLLSMEYFAVGASTRAVQDILKGPENLPGSLRTAFPRLRATATKHPELRVHHTGREPQLDSQPAPGDDTGPTGAALAWFAIRYTARHLLQPGVPSDSAPDATLPVHRARWWHMPVQRSVMVESRSGTQSRHLRRNRRQFVSLWLRSLRLSAQLTLRWDALSASYRDAWPELTSEQRWRQTLHG